MDIYSLPNVDRVIKLYNDTKSNRDFWRKDTSVEALEMWIHWDNQMQHIEYILALMVNSTEGQIREELSGQSKV